MAETIYMGLYVTIETGDYFESVFPFSNTINVHSFNKNYKFIY